LIEKRNLPWPPKDGEGKLDTKELSQTTVEEERKIFVASAAAVHQEGNERQRKEKRSLIRSQGGEEDARSGRKSRRCHVKWDVRAMEIRYADKEKRRGQIGKKSTFERVCGWEKKGYAKI